MFPIKKRYSLIDLLMDSIEIIKPPRSSTMDSTIGLPQVKSFTLDGYTNGKPITKRPITLNEFPFSIPSNLNEMNFSKTKLQRPLSTDFKRTISAIEADRLSHLTHRRTQSYAATTTHNRQQSKLILK